MSPLLTIPVALTRFAPAAGGGEKKKFIQPLEMINSVMCQ